MAWTVWHWIRGLVCRFVFVRHQGYLIAWSYSRGTGFSFIGTCSHCGDVFDDIPPAGRADIEPIDFPLRAWWGMWPGARAVPSISGFARILDIKFKMPFGPYRSAP